MAWAELLIVKKLFGGILAGKFPARLGFHLTPVKAETLRIESDLPYGMAAVTFRFPRSNSPDHAAVQVRAGVLSSQRGELYGLVRRHVSDAPVTASVRPTAG
jgi:zinc protease